jgi:PP-loop family
MAESNGICAPGVAVSGGADSMALAHLCKQLESSRLVDRLTVKAFVVDHKARAESSREARTVAGWLAGMGTVFLDPFLILFWADWDLSVVFLTLLIAFFCAGCISFASI